MSVAIRSYRNRLVAEFPKAVPVGAGCSVRATDLTGLTARERAVAGLVAAGMTNKQAAVELYVSVKTVQFHLTRIYAKLGIASRTELAACFREDG
ncbi:response regulator transcription factor [Saccharopolyspora sp. NFXS83]|uniref:response regulator transcription factor n=1 Tax=Saccharopolyspora sp. NFXS83 TaxID=2993560 RepID=UPI003A4E45E8